MTSVQQYAKVAIKTVQQKDCHKQNPFVQCSKKENQSDHISSFHFLFPMCLLKGNVSVFY